VTHQTPMNRRPSRQRINTLATEPMADRARPPTRMLDPQLHDARLDLRAHLMRTRTRHRRPVHQPGQPPCRVALQPAMHALARHPEAGRHLSDRHALVEHLEHSLIALLHKSELHQHDAHLSVENLDREAQPVSQPRVTRQPEPLSPDSRSHRRPGTGTAPENVARLPEPQRQASTGPAQAGIGDRVRRLHARVPGSPRTSRAASLWPGLSGGR